MVSNDSMGIDEVLGGMGDFSSILIYIGIIVGLIFIILFIKWFMNQNKKINEIGSTVELLKTRR